MVTAARTCTNQRRGRRGRLLEGHVTGRDDHGERDDAATRFQVLAIGLRLGGAAEIPAGTPTKLVASTQHLALHHSPMSGPKVSPSDCGVTSRSPCPIALPAFAAAVLTLAAERALVG